MAKEQVDFCNLTAWPEVFILMFDIHIQMLANVTRGTSLGLCNYLITKCSGLVFLVKLAVKSPQ